MQIFEITAGDLQPERFAMLAADLETSYYWSLCFEPDFYVALAQAGFICVTQWQEDRLYLLPELQPEYAVLHWQDLRIDRDVQRILRSDRWQKEGIRLRLGPDPDLVLDGLERTWGERSWLRGPYCDLIRTLARKQYTSFSIVAVELWAGSELVAGELGYAIGQTYTSLTGFLERRPEWNSFGKLQLVLLARELERLGFLFWNLGHPYMDYKRRLGAITLARADFLQLWEAACLKPLPLVPENLAEWSEA